MPFSLPRRRPAAMTGAGPLERIADNVMAVGARDRVTADTGAFRAFLSPDSADYLMSFAVPMATPPDWPPAIVDLRRVFEAHGRLVRLEIIHELFPDLGPALEAAGIARRNTQPLMVLAPQALRPRRLARGVDYRELVAGDADLLDGLIQVQQLGFGLPLDAAAESQWRRFLARGLVEGSVRAAVIRVDDRTVCGAALQIGVGAAELTGVATSAGYRRRGFASALCSRLLQGHFAAGHSLAWLSAADPVSGAIYRRLGFRPAGTQLNYGMQPMTEQPAAS